MQHLRNKKIIIVLYISLLVLNIFTSINIKSQTWENEYGKLEVYPDVSHNLIRQRQFYNATWYKAANNLDIAFVFDNPLSYGRIYVWNGTAYNKVETIHYIVNGKHAYVIEDVHFEQYQSIEGMWEYDTLPNSHGKWDMYIKLHSLSWAESFAQDKYIHLDPWWDSDWKFKKKITIDHNQVPGNLNNFPICINLSSDADLVANIGFPDGRDIAFTDSTEAVQLNHEIEIFKSGTGQLVAWVNITSLSSAVDTDIYMYYGNSGCANQSSPTDVWDSDYSAVYHMTGAVAGDIDDSTSHNLDVTAKSDNPLFNQNGICGKGVTFDGTNDALTVVDSAYFEFTTGAADVACTFEAVVKKTDNNRNTIISKFSSADTSKREWFWEFYTNSLLKSYFYDRSSLQSIYRYSTTATGNTAFTYVAATYDGGSAHAGIHPYITGNPSDGSGATSGTYANMLGSSQALKIAVYGEGASVQYFKGTIDEIRISKGIVRTANWIETTYNSIMNATSGGFFLLGPEMSNTNVEAPTNLTAVTQSNGDIEIDWTKGLNSSHTRIESNTVATWSRGTGNLLFYDTTNDTITHNGLSCGIKYYYQAWAYNSTQQNWSNVTTVNNISCPGNPSGISAILNPSNLSISWTINGYADKTVVVRKSNSYPSSPTDGTVICNTTNNTWDDVGYISGTHLYKIFSYNITVNRYSTGVEMSASSLTINVFDENTSLPLSDWSVHISNQAGSQVYEALGCTNPKTIDTASLPTGTISILINNSSYEPRIYYMTISAGNQYFLDAYLAEKNTTTNYYVIEVYDEYYNALSNVYVQVCEYDNSSGVFADISSQYTDASGQIGLYLIGGKHYKVNLTKSGYDAETGLDYFPDPNYYGIYYPKRYYMKLESIEPVEMSFSELCDFTIEWKTNNNTIKIHFDCKSGNATSIDFELYEQYNNTLISNQTWSYTNDNEINIWFSGANTSRMHMVVCNMTHDISGSFIGQKRYLAPLRSHTIDVNWIEGELEDVWGDMDFGWINLFVMYGGMMFILFILVAAKQPGLGIIGAGCYGFFMDSLTNTELTTKLSILISVLIFLGFLALVIKYRRDQ